MPDTVKLNMPIMEQSQSQKHVTFNEALLTLDAIIQLSVTDRGINAPPNSPVEGSSYIIGNNPVGAWISQAKKIAVYHAPVWDIYTPNPGWLCWVTDESKFYQYNGTIWDIFITSGGGGGTGSVNPVDLIGINTTASLPIRLDIKSDTSRFDHDGSGHNIVINKNATANTAVSEMQRNGSSRARIGLIENDDLTIQTSRNGVEWRNIFVADKFATALRIETATGTNGGLKVVNRTTGNVGSEVRMNNSGAGVIDLYNSAGTRTFELHANGNCYINNGINKLGIGTTNPSANLEVVGSIKMGSFTVATVPSASATGAGTQIYVTNAAGGATIAFSNGTNWLRIRDNVTI